MGWLPFGKSSSEKGPAPTQVEQRSHQPSNLDPQSDISHTLNQLDEASNGPIKLQKMTAETKKANDKMVGEFVCSLTDDINATYFECRKIK